MQRQSGETKPTPQRFLSQDENQRGSGGAGLLRAPGGFGPNPEQPFLPLHPGPLFPALPRQLPTPFVVFRAFSQEPSPSRPRERDRRGKRHRREEKLELPRSWAQRGRGGPSRSPPARSPPPPPPALPPGPAGDAPGAAAAPGDGGTPGGAAGGGSPGWEAPPGTRAEPLGATQPVHRSEPGAAAGPEPQGAAAAAVTERAGGCGLGAGGGIKPKTWASLQPVPHHPGTCCRRPRPHLGLLRFQ